MQALDKTQIETSLWLINPSTDTRTKKTHQDKTQLTKKERLNKTQEGLNETVRIQREDSINKLEQSKTSLRKGVILKPREVTR